MRDCSLRMLVSAATLSAVTAFYTGALRGKQVLAASAGSAAVACFQLANSDAVVRFVTRVDASNETNETSSSLGVAQVERMKRGLREAYFQDSLCGVDKFMDNHFAWYFVF